MWPKEHGAYGQLAFPILTAFAVAGVTVGALLIAIAAVSAFLAHEPLLVWLGRRGVRVRHLHHRRATGWLLVAGTVAVATGVAAVWLMTPDARWAFAAPLTPAALYAVALARGLDKNTTGELAAGFALSLIAVPMCVAAGAPAGHALSVGMTFALLSAANTLGVRIVVLRVRAGGDRGAVLRTRLLLACIVTVTTAAIAVLTMWASLSWITLAAVVPGIAASAVLAVRPPPPTRLRLVGWTLVSTSAIAMVLLILGLRVA